MYLLSRRLIIHPSSDRRREETKYIIIIIHQNISCQWVGPEFFSTTNHFLRRSSHTMGKQCSRNCCILIPSLKTTVFVKEKSGILYFQGPFWHGGKSWIAESFTPFFCSSALRNNVALKKNANNDPWHFIGLMYVLWWPGLHPSSYRLLPHHSFTCRIYKCLDVSSQHIFYIFLSIIATHGLNCLLHSCVCIWWMCFVLFGLWCFFIRALAFGVWSSKPAIACSKLLLRTPCGFMLPSIFCSLLPIRCGSNLANYFPLWAFLLKVHFEQSVKL